MPLLSDFVGFPLLNGNKGDLTVSSSGGIWTVNNGAISYGKIQNVSGTGLLLGRWSSGAGPVQEISLGAGLGLSGGVLSSTGSLATWTKEPVKAATTGNITLSGLQTVDTVVLSEGDRVLVKNQSTNTLNGIYIASSGSWVRASDADTSAKLAGATVAVAAGSVNGGAVYKTDYKSTNTLGSSAVRFYEVYDTSASSTSSSSNTLVLRNNAGDFSAGVITATLNGNAGTASSLQAPVTINGTNFDGSTNITTSNWGTARSITIGNTAKSVNGSANVSWSTSEIFPTNSSGNWWNGGPVIVAIDGVSEVGRYLDFHNSDTGTSSFDVRMDCTGPGAISFGATTVSANTFLAGSDGASSPAFSWAGSTSTGIYRVNTTTVGITCGGNRVSRFTTSGFEVSSDTGYSPSGATIGLSGSLNLNNNAGASGFGFAGFFRSGVFIGNITQSGTTGVSYNTTSDYRLKENATPLANATQRVKELKPYTFNFKPEPDIRIDGFFAHEVQEVVPSAVTGSKDAVDEEGNPIYQGMDASRLVPLLTAALQDALLKIEDLENRLETAGL